MHLLSRISGVRTVGSLRAKKQSGSTQRGLHVGSDFKEFRQTPGDRGFILFEFYTLFKCFMMFQLV